MNRVFPTSYRAGGDLMVAVQEAGGRTTGHGECTEFETDSESQEPQDRLALERADNEGMANATGLSGASWSDLNARGSVNRRSESGGRR